MENNWKEVAEHLAKNWLDYIDETSSEFDNCVGAIEEAMNLVFEATKKECADKAQILEDDNYFKSERLDIENSINKNSILNINKPNL
jgi:hypothetical protein